MVTKMERSLGIFSLGIWVLVAVLFGVALGIFLITDKMNSNVKPKEDIK